MPALVFNPTLIEAQFAGSLKLILFVAFLSASTLFIGFNYKIFEFTLGEKSKTYWWLFLVLVTLPFLLVIYAFSYFFGSILPS